MDFYSGIIKLQQHQGWGGKTFDSRHIAQFMGNYEKIHDLGVMVSRIFSSSDKFALKPFTKATIASGNVIEIEDDTLKWTAIGDDYQYNEFVTNLAVGNSRPGWGGETFKIGLREGWYHEPMVIIGGYNDQPLEIVGNPISRGTYYEYTVRLQSGNPNDFFDSQYLTPGTLFRKVSNSIAKEMNPLYPGVDFGSRIELQSQIGAFSGGFEVTDRALIKELIAKQKGDTAGSFNYTSGFGVDLAVDNGKVIEKGMFIPFAEAKVIDDVHMAREWSMNFGKASVRPDVTGRYIKKTGIGFREYCKDGNEQPYSTPPTAGELEDYFMSYIHNRVSEDERKMMISTGELGFRIFDQLLSDEAGAFLTVDDGKYVRQMQGGKPGDLEYGFQFRRFKAKNGLTIDISHDPIKDSFFYCPRKHPLNSSYTIDSARLDIMSFAPVKEGTYVGKSNVVMAKTKMMDSYFWVSSVVDPRTGKINNGSVVATDDKMTRMRYETSGGLVVFDPSLIGSLFYEPIT